MTHLEQIYPDKRKVSDMIIELQNIAFAYGTKLVLDQVSLSIPLGQVHGLLGPNGSGKSTLMKLIAGILFPQTGNIYVLNQVPVAHPAMMGTLIGLLSDKLPLYEELTVKDYLNFILHLRIHDKKRHREYLADATELMDLKKYLNIPIKKLSFGLKQRVGIAQAIIHRPQILLLDEPTLGLDPQNVLHLRSFIKSLRATHTVLISSHLLSEIEQLCDHVTILQQGKIILNDTMNNILHSLKKKKYEIMVSDWSLVLHANWQKQFPQWQVLSSTVLDEKTTLLLVEGENNMAEFKLTSHLLQFFETHQSEILSFTPKQQHLENIYTHSILNDLSSSQHFNKTRE